MYILSFLEDFTKFKDFCISFVWLLQHAQPTVMVDKFKVL